MRQTTFSKPPPYTGKRYQRFLTSGNKAVLDREARVKSRREAHTLIAEQIESAFEPTRDFAAEWEQAVADLYNPDWYACGCCSCCGHNDDCTVLEEWQAQRVENDAMCHFFETGEMLPV